MLNRFSVKVYFQFTFCYLCLVYNCFHAFYEANLLLVAELKPNCDRHVGGQNNEIFIPFKNHTLI